MKRWIPLLSALALAGSLPAGKAQAQEVGGAFGVGIGVSTYSVAALGGALGPSIYVPIPAGERFLVEPSFGLLRLSEHQTMMTFGSGLLYILDTVEDGRLYIGPRLGFLRVSNDFESETRLTLAGVLGGEFFLRPAFSLGGEAGLRWTDLPTGSMLATTAELRVRWYFR